MKRRIRNSQERFIDEMRAKQSNIVWPDTLRNGRSVDRLLWMGSAKASLVQKIGAWLFGLGFLAQGLVFLRIAVEDGSLLWLAASGALLFVGGRICLRATRKRRPSGNRFPG